MTRTDPRGTAGFIRHTFLFYWGVFTALLFVPAVLYQISKSPFFISYSFVSVFLFFTGSTAFLALRGFLKARSRRELMKLTLTASRLARGEKASVQYDHDETLDAVAAALAHVAQSLQNKILKTEKETDKLETIFTHMQEGVIAVDQGFQILISNSSAGRILGFPGPSEGKSLIEGTRNPEIESILHEAVRLKQTVTRYLDLTYPETKSLQVSAAAIEPHGSGICAILVIRDITEIRNLEKTRQEFVANVSHELKTPLTSINGFIETLLSGAVNDPEKRVHFLKIMQEDASRLSRLIHDLLDLSEIESGSEPLRKEELRIEDEIKKAAAVFEPVTGKKKISVELCCAPSLPLFTADRDRIQQVLVNLIDNAIKFSPEGGKITVSAGAKNGLLEVSVEDSGPGVPEDAMDRIFERFFRADKARSRETAAGTGLGLAIVKHILEAHGGSISCRNKPGQGTVFTFSLPL